MDPTAITFYIHLTYTQKNDAMSDFGRFNTFSKVHHFWGIYIFIKYRVGWGVEFYRDTLEN